MKFKFNLITFCLVTVFLVQLVFVIIHELRIPKVVYLDIPKVYSSFELKKEMEKKFLSTKGIRDKILDSLMFELQIITKQIKNNGEKDKALIGKYEIKKAEFLERKANFEEDNQALTKQYDEQILTQLNQYVKDFGNEFHYTYILGNDGNGSIMYGEKKNDVSDELILYINKKYKGLN